MEKPKRGPQQQALRRLQQALREELKHKGGVECRYVARCPVAKVGNCPGIC
jgi:hypothetical protein